MKRIEINNIMKDKYIIIKNETFKNETFKNETIKSKQLECEKYLIVKVY